jgi:hypothetical protein
VGSVNSRVLICAFIHSAELIDYVLRIINVFILLDEKLEGVVSDEDQGEFSDNVVDSLSTMVLLASTDVADDRDEDTGNQQE